jgi:hypothetical protein
LCDGRAGKESNEQDQSSHMSVRRTPRALFSEARPLTYFGRRRLNHQTTYPAPLPAPRPHYDSRH